MRVSQERMYSPVCPCAWAWASAGGDGGECALFVGQLVGEVLGGVGIGIAVVVGGEPHGAMGRGVGDLVRD